MVRVVVSVDSVRVMVEKDVSVVVTPTVLVRVGVCVTYDVTRTVLSSSTTVLKCR